MCRAPFGGGKLFVGEPLQGIERLSPEEPRVIAFLPAPEAVMRDGQPRTWAVPDEPPHDVALRVEVEEPPRELEPRGGNRRDHTSVKHVAVPRLQGEGSFPRQVEVRGAHPAREAFGDREARPDRGDGRLE